MQMKQTVRRILDRLPDDRTIEDVLCHPYVICSVERRLADAGVGKTIPHEHIVEDLRWV
jgi:hypothetical protein